MLVLVLVYIRQIKVKASKDQGASTSNDEKCKCLVTQGKDYSQRLLAGKAQKS